MMFYCDQDEKEWQGAGGIPGREPMPPKGLEPSPGIGLLGDDIGGLIGEILVLGAEIGD